MITASTIFQLTNFKINKKKSWILLLYLAMASFLSNDMCKFLQESDEFILPSHFRSKESNYALLTAISSKDSNLAFDTDSVSAIFDSGASSTATPNKSDFIESTYKELSGVTISGIASGLKACGIGSININFKDDDGHPITLQIDKVLHLKQLPIILVSPQQVLCQHRSIGSSYTLNHDFSVLNLDGFTKTINYDSLTNLPTLYTESDITKLYNLIQDGDNQDNLSVAQRSLLYWHRRLAHMDMERIKDFARKGFLPKEIANCKTPLCTYCIQAKQGRTSISRSATGGSIKSGNLKSGDKVSCDHYMSREPGLVANIHGCILKREHATCGTIMVDHASDFIFHFVQTSTEGSQTVEAKHKFERFAKNCGVDIKHYHADNKIFNEQVFRESCIAASQVQTFCGVNAHHQNGVAERKIKTVISLARAMLFTAMIKNPTVITLQFWPFAVHYAVDILNNTPNSSGFTPKEIFTGVKGDRNFKNFHTFGSPAFVLHPTIQKGNKLPTWSPRSLPSAFIGKSREHASNVSLVFKPVTNHISPQFHIVHDDDFQTVSPSGSNSLPLNWKEVFEIDHYANDQNFQTPLEAKVNDKIAKVSARFPDPDNEPANNTVALASEGDITMDSEGDVNTSSEETSTSSDVNPISNAVTNSESDGSFAQDLRTQSGRKIIKPKRYLQAAILGLLSMQSGINLKNPSYTKSISIFRAQMDYHQEIHSLADNTFNNLHPLSFMASKANNDVLYYHQAMKADDADEFRKAMKKEINSFKDEKIFELMLLNKKPAHKSLIPFVWSFKRKRNPIGELIKHKARLCVHGGKQIKGVDYWNTYAPVVQQITTRIMLVLHQVNGWQCRHLDYVLAFT